MARTTLIREVVPEMFGNILSSRDPHILLLAEIVHEFPQSREASRLAGDTGMQIDGHHLGSSVLALAVESVECSGEVVVECVGGAEGAGVDEEAEVIAVVASFKTMLAHDEIQ